MRHLLVWILIYTAVMAVGQIFLKMGLGRLAGFSLQNLKDALLILPGLLKSPYILLGAGLMAASFILWLFILSWFKLSLAFPLTALTYIFVVLLSYFMLGEKLLPQNYAGIVLIAFGIFFLLYK
jgi:drug/metabolite transporter (DMT)-like permease